MSVVVDLLNVSVRRCLFRLHGWSLQCPCYVTGKAVILFVFFLKAGNNITAHEAISYDASLYKSQHMQQG